MGGTKGVGAFTKNSTEAMELYKMFINRDIELTAEPNDVMDLFPSISDKTTTQIRSGFNRVRDNAKEALSVLTGKFFFNNNFVSVISEDV
jgi:hypothetical protein